MLHVVDHEQHVAPRQRGHELRLQALVTGLADADGSRDHAHDPTRRGHRFQSRERDLAPGCGERLGDLDRQARLADAARAHDRDHPHPGRLQHLDEPLLLVAPPDERRVGGRNRQHRVHHRRSGRPARRVEPIGQQGGDVGDDQLAQLLGRGEAPVRAVVVAADAVEQILQARIPIGCGVLDVDQMRHVARQAVLVFEARDLLVGSDPAVALPVQPDEDVALGEVGAVQRARRMRPRAQLEHDRGEVKRLDRSTSRFALGLQFAESGAQEDPDALVGSADRRRVSVHASSVAQSRAIRHHYLSRLRPFSRLTLDVPAGCGS